MQLQTISSKPRTDPKTHYHSNNQADLQLSENLNKTISAAETIQSPSLPLEGVNDIHGGDRLPPGVLRVRDGVTDNVLEKNLQDATCLLVDEATNPLDTTSSGQTPNRRLRDALDVIPEHLPVPLRSSFAQPLASLSTTRHFAQRDLGF
jgi:hypothetical protein